MSFGLGEKSLGLRRRFEGTLRRRFPDIRVVVVLPLMEGLC